MEILERCVGAAMVVLCTAEQRLAQIQRVEQREREIVRALATAEW